jgi:hypothetical protein
MEIWRTLTRLAVPKLARLARICVAAGSAAEADQADAKAAWLDGYLARGDGLDSASLAGWLVSWSLRPPSRWVLASRRHLPPLI